MNPSFSVPGQVSGFYIFEQYSTVIVEKTPYIIVTERLGLRRWNDSDIEPFSKMNQDAEVMKYFPKLLDLEETFKMIQRIKLHFDKNNFGLFAIENKLTREFIGYTGFLIPAFESFFTPSVEIGWRFKKKYGGMDLRQKLQAPV